MNPGHKGFFAGALSCLSALAVFFAASICARAVTISTGPFITKATNVPLAGILTLTTDELTRVSVSATDGTEAWQRDFCDYRTSHTVPLLGFKPARTYEVTIT